MSTSHAWWQSLSGVPGPLAIPRRSSGRKARHCDRYNTIIPLHLPSEATSAHKTGSLRGIRNDAGIVYAPGCTYTISLFSKRLADPVAGAAGLAQISRAIW